MLLISRLVRSASSGAFQLFNGNFCSKATYTSTNMPRRKAAATKSVGPKSKKRKTRDDSDDGSEEEPPKNSRAKKMPAKANASGPSINSLEFSCNAKSSDGKDWNMKISAWNVNGLRAWLNKDGLQYVEREDPDMFCLMETKCPKEKMPEESKIDGYTAYWLSGDTDGYSGVGLYTKIKPTDVTYGIGVEKHDNEGRVITAEYDNFYLVSCYVPNSGRKLVRLEYRQEWDTDFRAYLQKLDKKKPVIVCGDLNVSHKEIDIANPKSNKRNAGFTQEERDGFTDLLKCGFVDTFRHFHPDVKDAYTFWTYMMNARAKNVGWRLDYFVVSEKLMPQMCESLIRKDVHGSDHCPITLFLTK